MCGRHNVTQSQDSVRQHPDELERDDEDKGQDKDQTHGLQPQVLVLQVDQVGQLNVVRLEGEDGTLGSQRPLHAQHLRVGLQHEDGRDPHHIDQDKPKGDRVLELLQLLLGLLLLLLVLVQGLEVLVNHVSPEGALLLVHVQPLCLGQSLALPHILVHLLIYPVRVLAVPPRLGKGQLLHGRRRSLFLLLDLLFLLSTAGVAAAGGVSILPPHPPPTGDGLLNLVQLVCHHQQLLLDVCLVLGGAAETGEQVAQGELHVALLLCLCDRLEVSQQT